MKHFFALLPFMQPPRDITNCCLENIPRQVAVWSCSS